MRAYFWIAAFGVIFPTALALGAGNDLIAHYNPSGNLVFSPDRGKELWTKKTPGDDGRERDCGSCHGTDLTQPGKHLKSGKVIDPMAPSVNPDRYTDLEKTEKWLKRNCKWTFGRECTDQEKGDLLEYLARF